MLPKSYLKVIAAYVVYESKLSKYAKIQTLRFIEDEASEKQLMIFISEGKIRHVSDYEDISEISIKQIPGMIVASALAAGRMAYDKIVSKAAQACKDANVEDIQKCMREYRLKANYAKLTALKREMSKCNQTSDIKKCQKIFINHMKKIEGQIQRDRVFRR